MAIIAPFKGLTYNFKKTQAFSNLVAPPYDVISKEEQETYYRADPHNVIRLILGKQKTGDSDWDNRYVRAADLLKRWESEGILTCAGQPCIYVTSMKYNPGNGDTQRTRWGIITLVKIEDQDSKVILPHEKTFSAHRDDRLKLMRACDTQLSQIFSLYEDPDNTILNACKTATSAHPQIAFDLEDGTRYQMWILQNPAVFKQISSFLLKRPIFIADGHHRYETSRNFRDIMRARYGRRPANKSYEYVMMYLSNMNDKGLTILPSHRLIKKVPNFQLEPFLEKVGINYNIEHFPFSGTNILKESSFLKKKLEEAGHLNTVIGFYLHKSDMFHLFTLKPGAREQMGDDLHPSLKNLDVLALSRFILQRALGFSKEDLDNDDIFHYQSSINTAVSQVESGDCQIAFLLNPTRMNQVKEIATNSLTMPRKSTYFYPKVLTGLVFNKIDPYEIIQIP